MSSRKALSDNARRTAGGDSAARGMIDVEGMPGAIGRIPLFLAHRFPATLVKYDAETDAPVRDARGFCVRCAPNEVGEAIGQLLTAASCDHQTYLGADLPQEPEAGSGMLRIRRPIDQMRRRDDLTGHAHAHRPRCGVRHDGAVMPGGKAARPRPVRAGRPVLPGHVRLGQERSVRARKHPSQEVRERRGFTLRGRLELDLHGCEPLTAVSTARGR